MLVKHLIAFLGQCNPNVPVLVAVGGCEPSEASVTTREMYYDDILELVEGRNGHSLEIPIIS